MSSEPRQLFVGGSFSPLPVLPRGKNDYRVFLEFREGLAGAWTERREGEEIILFGYPAGSRNKWFQVLTPGRRHNAASLALERIIFARRINMLLVCDCSAERVALKGAAIHRESLTVISRKPSEPMEAFFRRTMDPDGTGR